jgi:hypothetical protein
MEDDGTYVKAIFEDGTKGFVGMAAGADGVEAYLYDYRNGVNISDPAEAAAKLDAELKERKKRDTPRDSDRREPEKLKINEEEEELDEMHCGGAREDEEEKELEEAQEKEVVEETISNDEWYQNELFESLKKRWTK